jgi:hypothetical protein
MAVTATPVFTQTVNVGALNAIVSTAMTNTKAFDGTETAGTALALVFTAGADGARIDQIMCRLASTNGATASGTSAATVVRFWANNNSVNTTAGNNIFIGEVAIPATAVTALGTTALTTYPLTLPLNGLNIPASYRIYGGLTVAAGGTNIAIALSAFGGNY